MKLRYGLLLAALTLCGCGGGEPPPIRHDAGFDLAAELDALRTLLVGQAFVTLALAVLGGLLAALLIRRAATAMWDRGWDKGGWVSRAATLGYIATSVVVADYIIVRFLRIAPLVTSVILGVALIAAAISAIGVIQNLAAGASIAFRGRIARGAIVDIGGRSGVIERVGPLATAVRTDDGSIVNVPNRLFARETYSTRSPEKTARVVVTLKQDKPVDAAMRERARRAAILCPYRQAGSTISVTVEGAHDTKLVVAFQTPSESLTQLAREFMEKTMEGPVLPLSTRISQSMFLARRD